MTTKSKSAQTKKVEIHKKYSKRFYPPWTQTNYIQFAIYSKLNLLKNESLKRMIMETQGVCAEIHCTHFMNSPHIFRLLPFLMFDSHSNK